MDVNTITTLISSVGFPIFTTLVLFYYIYNQQEKTNDTINKLSETINNNTKAMVVLQTTVNELTHKLGDDDEK